MITDGQMRVLRLILKKGGGEQFVNVDNNTLKIVRTIDKTLIEEEPNNRVKLTANGRRIAAIIK